MTATHVGIREFRAGLSDFVDADAPVAVTRHGRTVGYFIPVKEDRAADAAALRAAGEKLDALLKLSDDDVDAAVEDFKQLRREAKKKA
ncbi:antitoxin (DNA-binding transcriptional repressor) of toxin-antitoxin stability system [Nocardioides daedukensis]|uniref:Antitoxin (DNA-binding transcriptional repressor) of toxin-antitoxin stability system n=1 Tax=Nocardioides daedukensis TaxID=634462 RepID=A0A7Y9RZM8_9ACTN|nr:type II toxin-antitoxin system Phd/YefM family antitoxin [Nocardioides daedukensis]NYG59586.1 antitoxin (DNA-binding transcriptional repressor) of toxin-antitoxin stability system [Nocardioides daedukensis]